MNGGEGEQRKTKKKGIWSRRDFLPGWDGVALVFLVFSLEKERNLWCNLFQGSYPF